MTITRNAFLLSLSAIALSPLSLLASPDKSSWLHVEYGSRTASGRLCTIYNKSNRWIRVGACSGTCYGCILLTPDKRGDIVIYEYELPKVIRELEIVTTAYAEKCGRLSKMKGF